MGSHVTQDVDMVADLKPGQIDELASRLVSEFYADTGQMSVAIRYGRSKDTIIAKLVWYRDGGRTSDRQWSHVPGTATLRPLDWGYLRTSASNRGITDLVEKLFE